MKLKRKIRIEDFFSPGPPTFPRITLPEEKGLIEIVIEVLAALHSKKGGRQ